LAEAILTEKINLFSYLLLFSNVSFCFDEDVQGVCLISVIQDFTFSIPCIMIQLLQELSVTDGY